MWVRAWYLSMLIRVVSVSGMISADTGRDVDKSRWGCVGERHGRYAVRKATGNCRDYDIWIQTGRTRGVGNVSGVGECVMREKVWNEIRSRTFDANLSTSGCTRVFFSDYSLDGPVSADLVLPCTNTITLSAPKCEGIYLGRDCFPDK